MISFKKDVLKFNGNYRGKVVSNTDPKSFGRIKVEIFGIFDNINFADIPWAVPAFPLSSGAGEGFGSFAVPEVDSFVWCFFENGDVYQPVYFAEASDGIHGLPSERTTNYPNTKVLKTKNGITVLINDKLGSEEVKIVHPTGAYIQIDSNGNIEVSGNRIDLNP